MNDNVTIKTKKGPLVLLVLLVLTLLSFQVLAATGEVTKSGSTWTTKIDGSTVYTGNDMIDAINAACSGMGSGTIHVRNSGDALAPDGLRSVDIDNNQTIDFHGTTMNCHNPLHVYPVKGYNKTNVAVKNLNVTGVPRYILHFSGCSGITLTNITANTTRGTGIRIEHGSNLVMNGNINLHSPGHCIETMVMDGVDIGTVTVQSDKGCGVLLNTSTNSTIDAIYAYNCDYGQSYAGFRQANNNGSTYLGFLYARHCGRGLYTLTGSHDVTIDRVDIDDCSESGISSATTSYGVRVNSGTVTNSNKNIDIWDGASDICLKVNGGNYGDACGSSGYNKIQNRNSNKCASVSSGSSSNDASIIQESCNDSYWRQQFELVDAGGGYELIKNRDSQKCFRVVNDNVVQYTCDNTFWSEMFERESVGNGYYLIKNRNTGTCIQVEDGSSADGANISMAPCNSSYWRQHFTFSNAGSRLAGEGSIENEMTLEQTSIFESYPNPVDNLLNIIVSEPFDEKASMKIYNSSGQLVLSSKVSNGFNQINTDQLPEGIFIMRVVGEKATADKKLIVRRR